MCPRQPGMDSGMATRLLYEFVDVGEPSSSIRFNGRSCREAGLEASEVPRRHAAAALREGQANVLAGYDGKSARSISGSQLDIAGLNNESTTSRHRFARVDSDGQ
jgi:hypothetical protein